MTPVVLRDFLVALTTYLAAEAAYWLMEKIDWLADLRSDLKRYAAMAIAATLAGLAWLASLAMLYTPMPIGWRGWVEALFAVGATAAGLGQILHGLRILRRQN